MDKFNTHIELALYSQYTETVPIVRVQFANKTVWHDTVDDTKVINIVTPDLPAGNYWLSVRLENKDETEYQRFNKDMMAGIEYVRIQNYDYEFSIYSEYEPIYPEIWYQEQKNLGCEPAKIVHSNYLGWPGEWRLQIGLPVYRWIHVKTNQGWLI